MYKEKKPVVIVCSEINLKVKGGSILSVCQYKGLVWPSMMDLSAPGPQGGAAEPQWWWPEPGPGQQLLEPEPWLGPEPGLEPGPKQWNS